MFKKYSFTEEEFKKKREHVVNLNHLSINGDYQYAADMRKYGFSMSDSYIFDLKNNDYRNYISTWEGAQTRVGSNPDFFVISADKMLFGMVYGKLIKVPEVWATVTNGKINSVNGTGITEENVYDYLINHDGGVLKWRAGCDGFGITVFKSIDSKLYSNGEEITRESLLSIIDKCIYCILQRRVVQGDFENRIFDKSVNTIRIVSVRKPGEVEHEIIGAMHRIGTSQSAPVDNFCQGGGSAIIDLETGVLGKMTCSNSYDKNGKRIFYSCHPDTGAQIEGIKIPGWKEIKEKIIYLTKEIPFFEFTAWDVALTNDGIELIEINMSSSLNVFQAHGGMRNSLMGQKYRERGWLVDEEIFNAQN